MVKLEGSVSEPSKPTTIWTVVETAMYMAFFAFLAILASGTILGGCYIDNHYRDVRGDDETTGESFGRRLHNGVR